MARTPRVPPTANLTPAGRPGIAGVSAPVRTSGPCAVCGERVLPLGSFVRRGSEWAHCECYEKMIREAVYADAFAEGAKAADACSSLTIENLNGIVQRQSTRANEAEARANTAEANLRNLAAQTLLRTTNPAPKPAPAPSPTPSGAKSAPSTPQMEAPSVSRFALLELD